MALPQEKPLMLPHSQERRRHQRVRVNLLGRYMLADRREFPCQVINMSPGGMALVAPVAGEVGERVVAYVDHVGRLEGKIARQFLNGFAMTIGATPRRMAARPIVAMMTETTGYPVSGRRMLRSTAKPRSAITPMVARIASGSGSRTLDSIMSAR